jgi:hypothetical protein
VGGGGGEQAVGAAVQVLIDRAPSGRETGEWSGLCFLRSAEQQQHRLVVAATYVNPPSRVLGARPGGGGAQEERHRTVEGMTMLPPTSYVAMCTEGGADMDAMTIRETECAVV